jgi:hypothetical protein
MSRQLFAGRICVGDTDPGTYRMPGNNEDNSYQIPFSSGNYRLGRYLRKAGRMGWTFARECI